VHRNVIAAVFWRYFSAAAESAPRDCHLKYVNAHIQQTIILHNIVINIEIEVTSFIMLCHTYYNDRYMFMHMYNIISMDHHYP
jgi:hypothetical protein